MTCCLGPSPEHRACGKDQNPVPMMGKVHFRGAGRVFIDGDV